jgi:SAM-dependent methyltransferase
VYDEHRPDYPEAAVRWALELAPGMRVLDLAAGTGKLTRVLAGLAVDVVAVEPDDQMLGQLRETLPSVTCMSGKAEAIPLPDGSVDAVLVGQALHWFDMERAGPEIARVLVPAKGAEEEGERKRERGGGRGAGGGVMAALWNFDDDRVDWVAGLEAAAGNAGGATLSQWRAGDHEAHFAEVSLPGLFGTPERAEFPNGQRRTAASLTATISTHSRLLMTDHTKRTRILSQVSGYLEARPETSAGEFTFPIVTGAIRALRL